MKKLTQPGWVEQRAHPGARERRICDEGARMHACVRAFTCVNVRTRASEFSSLCARAFMMKALAWVLPKRMLLRPRQY
eukprot:6209275-Pleurochrysis_carterae.AAC.3